MPDLRQACATGRNTEETMPADALVLFGAMGDLAHKKIFPALYHMVRHNRWYSYETYRDGVRAHKQARVVDNCRRRRDRFERLSRLGHHSHGEWVPCAFRGDAARPILPRGGRAQESRRALPLSPGMDRKPCARG